MAMFGRKEGGSPSSTDSNTSSSSSQSRSTGTDGGMSRMQMSTSVSGTQTSNSMSAAPALGRRSPSDNNAPSARRLNPADRMIPSDRLSSDAAERKLTVGRGLSLSGEITACDILVVDGTMEAKLPDGKLLEITESGQFRGSAEVENADIAGRYDGQLTVHGRLTVRSTGRVGGIVKYGELEINVGGQIIGELQTVGSNSAPAVTVASAGMSSIGAGFRSASRLAAPSDDEDTTEK